MCVWEVRSKRGSWPSKVRERIGLVNSGASCFTPLIQVEAHHLRSPLIQFRKFELSDWDGGVQWLQSPTCSTTTNLDVATNSPTM